MPETIKEQTVEQLGGPSSVLARQRRDHAEMDRLMDDCQTLADGEDRERVLQETVQLVFSHAFAEETVLWPAVRRSVEDGHELTLRVEEEHQQINDLAADIERLSPASPKRGEKVQRVFALIRQDIRDEEDLVPPRLQESLPAAQLRRLDTAWDTVRRSAPPRHPAAPARQRGPGCAARSLRPDARRLRTEHVHGCSQESPHRSRRGPGAGRGRRDAPQTTWNQPGAAPSAEGTAGRPSTSAHIS
ncbi:hemerythrin domain-containing protein [Streptomyces sp. NPDC048825]|uniref:hemerythrin domain-containing protein n=1 Tax=Streptomyces sp. NPDC048825 TaxID=3365592 RepID=UPI003721AF5C